MERSFKEGFGRTGGGDGWYRRLLWWRMRGERSGWLLMGRCVSQCDVATAAALIAVSTASGAHADSCVVACGGHSREELKSGKRSRWRRNVLGEIYGKLL